MQSNARLAGLGGGRFIGAFVFLFSLSRRAAGVEIDNGVIGAPEVTCEEEMVTLAFTTDKTFTGRIFVKGMSDNELCNRAFTSNSNNSATFQLPAGACNMRRQRVLGPERRGVEQSMTVVISFHNKFITKVDRAYRCTCFYMEVDKVVNSQFEVSMLPTTSLVDTASMPMCTYSVRRESPDGEVVAYAKVGDMVFHVWECDSDMFGMRVHSCFVDDGNGEDSYELLDARGCAIDNVIMQNLDYDPALNKATVEAHVFKFADKITTYFQCAIDLCSKEDGSCDGVLPPDCSGPAAAASNDNAVVVATAAPVAPPADGNGAAAANGAAANGDAADAGDAAAAANGAPRRQRRALQKYGEDKPQPEQPTSTPRRALARALLSNDNLGLDVSADRIVVLDLEDAVSSKLAASADGTQSVAVARLVPSAPDTLAASLLAAGADMLADRADRLQRQRAADRDEQTAEVCMGALGFGLIMTLFMAMMAVSAAVLCVHCARHRLSPLIKP